MMRFVADENFNGKVFRGLQQLIPDLDIIRVQDTEMFGASDPDLLAWSAEQNRIVLTHDVQTLVGFAYERVQNSQSMPGVIVIHETISLGQIINDLSIMIGASTSEDFENQVKYIPI